METSHAPLPAVWLCARRLYRAYRMRICMAMAAVTMSTRRLVGFTFLARRIMNYGRFYTESAPSRGLIYTSHLAEATVSLASKRPLPVYRVMNADGSVLDSQQDPNVSCNNIKREEPWEPREIGEPREPGYQGIRRTAGTKYTRICTENWGT